MKGKLVREKLADIIKKIHSTRQSGLLSIATTLEPEDRVSMYFWKGEVYYVTHGNKADDECFKHSHSINHRARSIYQLTSHDLASCYFSENTKLSVIQSDMLPTTEEIIRILNKRGSIVDVDKSKAVRKITDSADKSGTLNIMRIRTTLAEALKRQIGASADAVLVKVIDEKWRVLVPTKDDLVSFVSLLKDEIKDRYKQEKFVRDAERIIAL